METEREIREGDVLVCVFGYVDKIVDFYRVVKGTRRTVLLRKLKNKVVRAVHRDGPAGANLVVPGDEFDDGSWRGGAIRKKIRDDGSVRIVSYGWARKWNGEPIEEVRGYY